MDGDYALYAYRHSEIWEDIAKGRGKARFWKKRYTGYVLDGCKVYATRDVLTDLSPSEAFESLNIWGEWVKECNANISSFASTAWSIWQASLTKRILLASNTMPMPRESLLIGGRQDAAQGIYDDAEYWDISGAYQSAMGNIRIGARYRHVSGGPMILRESTWKDCVGFARAEVHLRGEMEWGPVPVGETRITAYPKTGRHEGIYDLQELRMAQECGATVIIWEAWIGRGIRVPFSRWSDLISSGRELPGMAGKIAKIMGNSLWGAFSVSGRGAWIHYADGRPVTERDAHDKTPPCKPLSAHISAFIRARLYREAMAHFSSGPFCIAAHTDGVIFQQSCVPNGPIGSGLGKWRKKADMERLVLLTAQAYKYRDPKTGADRYVVAGAPDEYAPGIFRAILTKTERRQALARSPHLLDFGASPCT